jgi:D-galactarolactone cycloisomerase
MKVGWHNPRVDAQWANAVLDAIPEAASLALDANRVLDLAGAAQLMQGIRRPERISWLEEPCSNRHLLAYAELRQRLSVPIAGGESMGMAMLQQVIAGRMMDIVQPDLVGHGGFAAMQHLFALCDERGVRLIPHCFDGQLMRVATLHLLAAQPDWEEKHGWHEAAPVEVDISPNPIRDELLVEQLLPGNDGRLRVPEGSGLGVTVNKDFVAKVGQPICP